MGFSPFDADFFCHFCWFFKFSHCRQKFGKKWKKPCFSFKPTDVHVVFFPSLNTVPIIIYLKWIMHYLAIYLVLFRAFVIAAMRKSIRGNSNLQNWVENGLNFFPCSMLKNVWVQAVKIRITTCILTVSSQFRKKCANNWQICMFLKNFEQRISPMKAFFLLFSSQNSTFFQILEHYVHRSRQPPHHLMSTLMMIIFSFVFRSDGAMIPKWKFSSGFKQKKNSLPASFLISEKKVYFEIGKIVYL